MSGFYSTGFAVSAALAIALVSTPALSQSAVEEVTTSCSADSRYCAAAVRAAIIANPNLADEILAAALAVAPAELAEEISLAAAEATEGTAAGEDDGPGVDGEPSDLGPSDPTPASPT